MVNPIYLFFSSRAGTAATVLRITLGVFLLHDAYCQSRMLHDPTLLPLLSPWVAWDLGVLDNSWAGLITKYLAGFSLLCGLFTRLISGALFIMLALQLFSPPMPEAMGLKASLLSLALALSLTIGGGGRFSLDRKISQFLLPTLG
jgi:uncharacterized membrane protein YphA (DoxX/SURF4 family)